MFVRITFREEAEGSILIECDRVSVHPVRDDDARVIVVTERGGAQSQTFDLRKGEAEVYVMNDAGRTVDRYRWPVPEVPPQEVAG